MVSSGVKHHTHRCLPCAIPVLDRRRFGADKENLDHVHGWNFRFDYYEMLTLSPNFSV